MINRRDFIKRTAAAIGCALVPTSLLSQKGLASAVAPPVHPEVWGKSVPEIMQDKQRACNLTHENIIDLIVDCGTALDEQDVPTKGRRCYLPNIGFVEGPS